MLNKLFIELILIFYSLKITFKHPSLSWTVAKTSKCISSGEQASTSFFRSPFNPRDWFPHGEELKVRPVLESAFYHGADFQNGPFQSTTICVNVLELKFTFFERLLMHLNALRLKEINFKSSASQTHMTTECFYNGSSLTGCGNRGLEGPAL